MKLYKYGNRKVYCPTLKRYVTQSEMLTLVRSGSNLEILCHKTKAPVTGEVLIRALTTEARSGKISNEEIFNFIRES